MKSHLTVSVRNAVSYEVATYECLCVNVISIIWRCDCYACKIIYIVNFVTSCMSPEKNCEVLVVYELKLDCSDTVLDFCCLVIEEVVYVRKLCLTLIHCTINLVHELINSSYIVTKSLGSDCIRNLHCVGHGVCLNDRLKILLLARCSEECECHCGSTVNNFFHKKLN